MLDAYKPDRPENPDARFRVPSRTTPPICLPSATSTVVEVGVRELGVKMSRREETVLVAPESNCAYDAG